MALKYKTRAFVFKKSDINESDRIFSVFTQDYGRLNIFAKAIRKSVSKLRSGVGIFSMSDIEFIQGKNKKTLTETKLLEKFGSLTQDLEKFRVVNKIGEVLDNFLEGQEKDEAIFNLINETFIKLNSLEIGKIPTGNPPMGIKWKLEILYDYFLWNFLSFLGYKPEVYKCASCRGKLNPYNLYFSNKTGGVICKKCLGHDALSQRINSDIVKLLRLIFKNDWQVLSKLKIESSSQKLFQKISNEYCSYNSFKNS